ncbi:MAG: kelch repeat-containing protein [Candidatus Eisenbacteria bacterium]
MSCRFRWTLPLTAPISIAILALLAAAVSFVPIAPFALADVGQWSQSRDWSRGNEQRYAVHAILLRGDGSPHHSRIVYFHNQLPDTTLGGQWGWTPGNDGCGTFPDANFALLDLPKANMDLFCSGHAAVGDNGRVLFASGTHPVTQQYGENKTHVFTPGSGATGIGDWTTVVPPNMTHWRWYSSVASLRLGKGLVVSGTQHPRHRLLFGLRDGSPPASPLADSVQLFAPIPDGAWDAPVLPAVGINGRPTPRSGHTATNMRGTLGFNGLTVFGGADANGPTNDLWSLFQDKNQLGDRQTYSWIKIQPGGSAPLKRTDHGAIAVRDTNLNLVFFGGLDEDNVPLGDAWRIAFRPAHGDYTCNEIQSSGGPLRALRPRGHL